MTFFFTFFSFCAAKVRQIIENRKTKNEKMRNKENNSLFCFLHLTIFCIFVQKMFNYQP